MRPQRDREEPQSGREELAVPAPTAPTTAAERILALQRSAGNASVAGLMRARTLARAINIPLRGPKPAGARAVSLATFLQIIRAEEAKVPDPANTKLMITQLRKLFYGASSWDSYLIPGAAGTAPLYQVEEYETQPREDIPIPYAPDLEHVQKGTRLLGAPAALADPSAVQEVEMPNGDFVDVGHVLAGLDALNHPGTASGPLGLFPVASNVGAVTWIGDLGSVVGEAIIQRAIAGRSTTTDADVQAQVDRMAPPQDMLGNVDAYVIGDAFTINTAHGLRVSDMLEQYYGGPGAASAAGAAARSQRFTRFANLVGLGALSGSAFANEVAWKATYLPQLQNATALYVGASTSGLPNVRGGFMTGASYNRYNARVLDQFVENLKVEVAREAAVPAGAATP